MVPIELRAYSGECLIHGSLGVPAEMRLTDFLNGLEDFAVGDLVRYGLADGRADTVGDGHLAAADLWAVEPTDSGVTAWHTDMRVATRATRIEIDMPPYRIRGTLHGLRGRRATVNRKRRRMVPLTDAEVIFTYAGRAISRKSRVIIINRESPMRVRRLTALRQLAPA